jgi:hypothetical protein
MDQNSPDDAHINDQLHNGVEQFRPERPGRPDDESTGKGRRKSSLSIIMAGGALLFGIAILALLSAPLVGVVLGVIGIVLLLSALAAFHYVVWGWWLAGSIREEVEAEERAEEETRRRMKHYAPGGSDPSGPDAHSGE